MLPNRLFAYLELPKGLEFGKDTWRETPHKNIWIYKYYIRFDENDITYFISYLIDN